MKIKGNHLFNIIITLTGLGVFLFAQETQAQISGSKKPNIIYVMADDLGYGDLGCYGQQKIQTPRLDRMAEEGVRFTQHYAGSTVCGPSRASLLTGKHRGHASLRGNPRWTSVGKPVDMPAEEVTVAEELKRAGYTTGIVGKWGLAEAGLEFMPLYQGFDYFYGFRKHLTAHNYYPEILWENNDPFHPEGNDKETKSGQYSHDSLTSKAFHFIKQNAGNPFFLYLAYTVPHYELTVPGDSKEPYKKLDWEERKMPAKRGSYYHDPDGNVTYAAMVSRMDRDMGKLFDLLKTLGIDENTLVIFTSDNGHEYDKGFFNSNGPLKGHKRDLYEGGIRIPFIARWPGEIQPGSVNDHISAFWDFLPTACDIAGVRPAGNIDGISYLPTLRGQKQEAHEYLYWEFNERQGPIQAIRKGNWKAVKFYKKPLELYDLSKDIGEENNVADKHAKVVTEFEQLFTGARQDNPYFPLTPHPRVANKFK